DAAALPCAVAELSALRPVSISLHYKLSLQSVKPAVPGPAERGAPAARTKADSPLSLSIRLTEKAQTSAKHSWAPPLFRSWALSREVGEIAAPSRAPHSRHYDRPVRQS